jgi:hypothetical protein
MLKGGLISLTEKLLTLGSGRLAGIVAVQSALCFVLSAAVHAAATFSVLQSAPAAIQVFAGFSIQIFGIMDQQGVQMLLSLSGSHGERTTKQVISKVIEATIGITWIFLSLSTICMDPALRAVIKSVDQLVPIWA